MNIQIGEFIFDPDARELLHGERVHRLEPKAASVLARLANEAAQTVRRSELLDACWPSGEGSDEALTQAIAQVRRVFGMATDGTQYVQTIARTGYRLRARVGAAPPSHEPPAPAVSELGARRMSGAPRLWLAFATVLVTLAAAALIAPHGARHWFMHAFM